MPDTRDQQPIRLRARATREEIEARLRLHNQTVDELLAEISSQVDPPIADQVEAVRTWIRQDAHAFTLDVFRTAGPSDRGKRKGASV